MLIPIFMLQIFFQDKWYPWLKIRLCEEMIIEVSVQFVLISPVFLSFQGS